MTFVGTRPGEHMLDSPADIRGPDYALVSNEGA